MGEHHNLPLKGRLTELADEMEFELRRIAKLDVHTIPSVMVYSYIKRLRTLAGATPIAQRRAEKAVQ